MDATESHLSLVPDGIDGHLHLDARGVPYAVTLTGAGAPPQPAKLAHVVDQRRGVWIEAALRWVAAGGACQARLVPALVQPTHTLEFVPDAGFVERWNVYREARTGAVYTRAEWATRVASGHALGRAVWTCDARGAWRYAGGTTPEGQSGVVVATPLDPASYAAPLALPVAPLAARARTVLVGGSAFRVGPSDVASHAVTTYPEGAARPRLVGIVWTDGRTMPVGAGDADRAANESVLAAIAQALVAEARRGV